MIQLWLTELVLPIPVPQEKPNSVLEIFTSSIFILDKFSKVSPVCTPKILIKDEYSRRDITFLFFLLTQIAPRYGWNIRIPAKNRRRNGSRRALTHGELSTPFCSQSKRGSCGTIEVQSLRLPPSSLWCKTLPALFLDDYAH